DDEGWNFVTLKGIRDTIFLPWADDEHGWATLFATTRFGGGGGAGVDRLNRVGDGSMFGTGFETLLHEFGHTMPGLWDEYTAGEENCGESANITAATKWEDIPWRNWVDPLLPVPTPYTGDYLDEVGAFEGGAYSFFGCQRPTARGCYMGAGGFGEGYGLTLCSPCVQRVICFLYQYVDVIENPFPISDEITVTGAETMTFSADIVHPTPNTQTWEWILNGEVIATGVDEVTVTFGDCADYELVLAVNDTTDWVRFDERFAETYPKPYEEQRWFIQQSDVTSYDLAAFAEVIPADCSGTPNGQIDFLTTGGQAPFSFIWENEDLGNPAENLAAGDYIIQVVDANGCNTEVELAVPQAPILAPQICSEWVNDQWNLSVVDHNYATNELSYQWSTGAQSPDLTDVESGTYSVTVTTSEGCTVERTATVVFDQPGLETSSEVHPSSLVESTGRIYLTPSGGNPAYEISWREKYNKSLTEANNPVILTGGDFGQFAIETFCLEDLGNSGGACTENELAFKLIIDDFGNETTWELADADDNILFNGGPYPNNFEEVIDLCLPNGCYEFRIYDDFGDGICCQYGYGGYFFLNENSEVAVASAFEDPFIPENAFDGSPSSKWRVSGSGDEFLTFQMVSPGVVKMYAITSADNEPEADPSTWRIEGSQNGTDWTVLDQRSGEAFETRLQRRIFQIPNETAYAYYRLYVENNNGGGNIQLQELEFVGWFETEPWLELPQAQGLEDRIFLKPGIYEYQVKDESLLARVDSLYVGYGATFVASGLDVVQIDNCRVGIANPNSTYEYLWLADEEGQILLGTGSEFQPPQTGNFFVQAMRLSDQALSDNARGFAVEVVEAPMVENTGDALQIVNPEPDWTYRWYASADCDQLLAEGTEFVPTENGVYYAAAWRETNYPDPIDPESLNSLVVRMDAADLDADGEIDDPLPSSSIYDWQFSNGNEWYEGAWFALRSNYQNGLPVADFATMWFQWIDQIEGPYRTMLMAYEENPLTFPEAAPFEAMRPHFPKHIDASQIYGETASAATVNGTTYFNGQVVDPFNTPTEYDQFQILGTVLASQANQFIDATDVYWEGKIGELMFFSEALDEATMLGLSEHLRRKWFGNMELESPKVPILWEK
ncbi:MAG: M64 family metallopeptidase, partial [Bacteroidota bacterium]